MIFRRNLSRNWSTKNHHAEGKCITKHSKIDGKKQADDLFACLSIRRHAEANCIKKHAQIDDFSSKFEQKLNQKNPHAEGKCIKKHARIDGKK